MVVDGFVASAKVVVVGGVKVLAIVVVITMVVDVDVVDRSSDVEMVGVDVMVASVFVGLLDDKTVVGLEVAGLDDVGIVLGSVSGAVVDSAAVVFDPPSPPNSDSAVVDSTAENITEHK